ncbi:hypothetical protein DID76_04650, partial [Candidatus Marinamargulisbacteria bacterium SCGC AG-414-C22]
MYFKLLAIPNYNQRIIALILFFDQYVIISNLFKPKDQTPKGRQRALSDVNEQFRKDKFPNDTFSNPYRKRTLSDVDEQFRKDEVFSMKTDSLTFNKTFKEQHLADFVLGEDVRNIEKWLLSGDINRVVNLVAESFKELSNTFTLKQNIYCFIFNVKDSSVPKTKTTTKYIVERINEKLYLNFSELFIESISFQNGGQVVENIDCFDKPGKYTLQYSFFGKKTVKFEVEIVANQDDEKFDLKYELKELPEGFKEFKEYHTCLFLSSEDLQLFLGLTKKQIKKKTEVFKFFPITDPSSPQFNNSDIDKLIVCRDFFRRKLTLMILGKFPRNVFCLFLDYDFYKKNIKRMYDFLNKPDTDLSLKLKGVCLYKFRKEIGNMIWSLKHTSVDNMDSNGKYDICFNYLGQDHKMSYEVETKEDYIMGDLRSYSPFLKGKIKEFLKPKSLNQDKDVLTNVKFYKRVRFSEESLKKLGFVQVYLFITRIFEGNSVFENIPKDTDKLMQTVFERLYLSRTHPKFSLQNDTYEHEPIRLSHPDNNDLVEKKKESNKYCSKLPIFTVFSSLFFLSYLHLSPSDREQIYLEYIQHIFMPLTTLLFLADSYKSRENLVSKLEQSNCPFVSPRRNKEALVTAKESNVFDNRLVVDSFASAWCYYRLVNFLSYGLVNSLSLSEDTIVGETDVRVSLFCMLLMYIDLFSVPRRFSLFDTMSFFKDAMKIGCAYHTFLRDSSVNKPFLSFLMDQLPDAGLNLGLLSFVGKNASEDMRNWVVASSDRTKKLPVITEYVPDDLVACIKRLAQDKYGKCEELFNIVPLRPLGGDSKKEALQSMKDRFKKFWAYSNIKESFRKYFQERMDEFKFRSEDKKYPDDTSVLASFVTEFFSMAILGLHDVSIEKLNFLDEDVKEVQDLFA